MSPELLALLDARVKERHAAGRAEYVRELIRRDVLSGQTSAPTPPSEPGLLEEYHALVDQELDGRLFPAQAARLRELEGALDQAEAREGETRAMFSRLEETAAKLDALLAAVRALPKAQAEG